MVNVDSMEGFPVSPSNHSLTGLLESHSNSLTLPLPEACSGGHSCVAAMSMLTSFEVVISHLQRAQTLTRHSLEGLNEYLTFILDPSKGIRHLPPVQVSTFRSTDLIYQVHPTVL